MKKECRSCEFSKTIRYRIYSGYAIRHMLVCIVGPPCDLNKYDFRHHEVSMGYKTLERYKKYPKITTSAPCSLHKCKSTKEIAKLEVIHKKEKEEAAQKKLNVWEEKKEKQKIYKKERDQKIAAMIIIKAKRDKEKKERTQKKKRLIYQKEYRAKIKAEKLLQQIESEKINNRFELLDI